MTQAASDQPKFPSLAEIAADPTRYLADPQGLEILRLVVRANVTALAQGGDVPPAAIEVLAHMGRIFAYMGVTLAEARKQIILLTIESPGRVQ
jgi:hypothetical protein